MPAQATANKVMASAKRLMELRQCWLSSSRIAEISVPAWPIPIHQTKFVIAKPHITGVANAPDAYAFGEQHRHRPAGTAAADPRPTVKPANQNERRLLGEDDGGDLIGDRAEGIARSDDLFRPPADRLPRGSSAMAYALDLRIRIAQGRQIRGARPRVEVGQQCVIPFIGFQLGHAAVLVVDIAEDDRLGRASGLAGGLDLAIADLAVLLLGIDFGGVDALHAVRAFFHDAAAAHRDIGIVQQLQAGRFEIADTGRN